MSLQGYAFPFRSLLARPYADKLLILVLMWFFWYIGNYGFLDDATKLVAKHSPAQLAVLNQMQYPGKDYAQKVDWETGPAFTKRLSPNQGAR